MLIRFLLIAAAFTLALIGIFYFINSSFSPTPPSNTTPEQRSTESTPRVQAIAENLVVPWALIFLPDNRILVTERPGRVKLIDPASQTAPKTVGEIEDVLSAGEGGLLGIALHPDFPQNSFIYVYYTYASEGENTLNRVTRFKLENETLQERQIILDQIPGASNHNGGRLKFGPDNFLYITTGDAQNPSLSQDRNSLAGKILRVMDEGNPAPGNPFNNHTYAYGLRNPQGLTWDNQGRLWSSDHGSTATDEINQINAGGNYGWPNVRGDQTQQGIVSPAVQSGSATWAPSGLAFLNNSLYFGGLRGQALFQVDLNRSPMEATAHLEREFGRIRDVVVGPDNSLYITTSNRDGRGLPNRGDDKILAIDPKQL